MKKWFFVFVSLIIAGYFLSCVKGNNNNGYITCTGPQPAADSTPLLNFAAKNGITPDLDSTGLYYQILDTGAGSSPVPSARLYVTYIGKLMDGTIFDSTTNSESTGYVLNTLIKGWQIGLPKIKVGGHIKLLIPSAYGYGCAGSPPNIPSNAPLYYDVTLVKLQF